MLNVNCVRCLQVKLPGNPRSTFWRYHTEGVTDEGVCTIEALHLLMRALAGRNNLQGVGCSSAGRMTAATADSWPLLSLANSKHGESPALSSGWTGALENVSAAQRCQRS